MNAYVLRHFMYLDARVVDDFLASIEGTLYGDESVTQRKGGERSFSGKVGASGLPFELGGKTGGERSTETTRRGTLTDAAKFHRLYSYLDDQNWIQYHAVMNETTWQTLERNSVLEFAVELGLSEVVAVGDVLRSALSYEEDFRTLTGQALFDSADVPREQVQAVLRIISKFEDRKGIPVVMRLAESPEYKLVAYLHHSGLRVPKDELAGEATVFCKIRRKIEEGSKIELFNPVELRTSPWLNRKERDMVRDSPLAKRAIDPVQGPAAVVSAVAIYR